MTEELVGKQLRRWELDQRTRRRFERDEVSCGMDTPVVTISRQLGSGGTSIAKLVARELDFKLYDREIIDHVAELAGMEPEQLEKQDEELPGVVSDLVLQLLEGNRPTVGGYLRILVRVVRQVGMKGEAVIIGRAANYILPNAFRVRIIAPEALRVARVAELHDMDEKAARRMVIETDRKRHRFVRSGFGSDQDDLLGYDLVINTQHCSIEHAAALITAGFRERKEALEAACRI